MALTAEDLCFRIDLDQLYPKFREKLLEVLTICLEDGLIYVPTQGIRSQAEQDKLYKKGASTVRFGYHLCGLAADCAFEQSPKFDGKKLLDPSWEREDMEPYGLAAEAIGLVWGGSWADYGRKKGFSDVPHIELSEGLNLKDLRKIYEKGGIKEVWKFLDTLDFG